MSPSLQVDWAAVCCERLYVSQAVWVPFSTPRVDYRSGYCRHLVSLAASHVKLAPE